MTSTREGRSYRSCDLCRIRKVRCNVDLTTANPCSNCTSKAEECMVTDRSSKTYTENLEKRLETLSKILERLNTGSIELSSTIPSDPSPDEEEEDQDYLIVQDKLKALSVSDDSQYFGKSSSSMFVNAALESKYADVGDAGSSSLFSKRMFFWEPYPWELASVAEPAPAPGVYIFPDEDLMCDLTNLYFERFNIYMPLLNRRLFENNVRNGLHLRDRKFAAVLLAVCALGSRFSTDPRCLAYGDISPCRNGWKWFSQVPILPQSWDSRTSLYDLQLACLSAMLLQAGTAPQVCWSIVTISLRLAQDVGAHRSRPQETTAEAELWKRVWWVLVCLDRLMATAMGRSCAIYNEDFDIDFPLECDDEFWEHSDPKLAFTQPSNKPSSISYFVQYNKLMAIQLSILRSLYSVNSSYKAALGFVGPEWETYIIAKINSALDDWYGDLPDHLRWNANHDHLTFFRQSFLLHLAFHHARILLYRPFIPSPRKQHPLSITALAICVHASQAVARLLETHYQRMECPIPYSQVPIFTSGMMLLIDLWDAQKLKRPINVEQRMGDVQICIRALRMCKEQWSEAEKLSNILEALCVSDRLLTTEALPITEKESNSPEDRQKAINSPLNNSLTPIRSLLDYSASLFNGSSSYLSQLATHWLSLKDLESSVHKERALMLGTWGAEQWTQYLLVAKQRGIV